MPTFIPDLAPLQGSGDFFSNPIYNVSITIYMIYGLACIFDKGDFLSGQNIVSLPYRNNDSLKK